MTEKAKSAYIVTPVVRLSFVNLFSARLPKNPKAGDRARFSTAALVLPSDKFTTDIDKKRWDALLAAIIKCGKESALGPEKFALFVKDRKIKLPHREDVESSGFPADYKYVIRPWTYTQPGIVSIYKGADGKPIEIKDPSKVYSGVWARLSVRPFYTNYENQNPSIGLQLQNVQIVQAPEGFNSDRLDGKLDARDEFDAEADLPEGVDLGATGGDVGASGGDAAELARLLGGA